MQLLIGNFWGYFQLIVAFFLKTNKKGYIKDRMDIFYIYFNAKINLALKFFIF